MQSFAQRIGSKSSRKNFFQNTISGILDGSITPAAIMNQSPVLSIKQTPRMNATKNNGDGFVPMNRKDLDQIFDETWGYGAELDADHPGFTDQAYRERRKVIGKAAKNFRHGDIIPTIDYTEDETATWATCFNKLSKLAPIAACKEYNNSFPHLKMTPDEVPQLKDITNILDERTGFMMRPVSGLLASKNFLHAIAYKVFSSTQYIRHNSVPFYTPEPDLIHELIGHAPLLADPTYGDFSQAVGVASLGAVDDDITKLATVYWFSMEFGVCEEEGEIKAYGAGILSSYGEVENTIIDKKADIQPFDPFKMAVQPYPITQYQPIVFNAETLKKATEIIKDYSKTLDRHYEVDFDYDNLTASRKA